MITIDAQQCTGCGACLEVCPTGALYLVDGQAVVDSALCTACEACASACPVEAIRLRTAVHQAAASTSVPAVGRATPVIRAVTKPEPATLRARMLPAVGTALAWAGREVLPCLADVLLDAVQRPTTRPLAPGGGGARNSLASGTKGAGRQHRRRWRGAG